MEISLDDARAIVQLFKHPSGECDLGAAIDFVNEQERAFNAERAIQNVPPDEGGR